MPVPSRLSARVRGLLPCLLTMCSVAAAQPDAAAPADARAQRATELVALTDPLLDRALSFLKLTQRADGGWDGPTGAGDPAITALVAKCFIQSRRYGPRHRIVGRALDYMLTFVRPFSIWPSVILG